MAKARLAQLAKNKSSGNTQSHFSEFATCILVRTMPGDGHGALAILVNVLATTIRVVFSETLNAPV